MPPPPPESVLVFETDSSFLALSIFDNTFIIVDKFCSFAFVMSMTAMILPGLLSALFELAGKTIGGDGSVVIELPVKSTHSISITFL